MLRGESPECLGLTEDGLTRVLEETARLLREWETLGRPPIRDWRCTFAETGPASAPILTPRDWSLVGEAIEPRS